MPRGSRPGERRGGRERGTPNKKTALKNAAIKATAGNPNLKPLDFLLGMMRDANLPLEVRVRMAQAAAPYVHSRLQGDTKSGGQYGNAAAVTNVQRAAGGSADGGATSGASAPTSPTQHATAPSAEEVAPRVPSGDDKPSAVLSPLDFLLSVMRDPDASPDLRLRVAQIAAPYTHVKKGGLNPANQPLIDPAVAMAIRTAQLRLEMLNGEHQYWRKNEPKVTKEEEAQLRARIAELVKTIDCPFELLEKARNLERLMSLSSARLSPTADPFSEKTKAEEAQLMAVQEAYEASPESIERNREWSRLMDLGRRETFRFYAESNPLTPAERSELESLRARHPEAGPDQYRHRRALGAIRKAREAEKAREAREREERRKAREARDCPPALGRVLTLKMNDSDEEPAAKSD